MKITIYTISDCPFSKQEKDYLTSHNLQYEEKNLETNKEFLSEMLTLSNNFAGTPVTKIDKDDGQIAVLKGFTKEEFDQALNIIPASATPSIASQSAPVIQPKEETRPAVQTAESSINAPDDTTKTKQPEAPAVSANPVNSVNDPAAPPAPVQGTPEPEPPEPEHPNPSPEPLPPIPTPIPENNTVPSDESHVETPAIQTAESSINIPSDIPASQPSTVTPPAPVVAETASTVPPAPQTDKLNDILNSLQKKSDDNVNAPTANVAPTPAPPAPTAMPKIPDPDFH